MSTLPLDRPWKITNAGVSEEIEASLGDGAEYILAYIRFTGDVNLQNAHRELIVRAVNNHDKLVESIQKIAVEWERQKGLFPQLSKDGWMDLLIKESLLITEP